MAPYERLFSPLTVRGMTLRNRIVMPPIGTNFALPSGGLSGAHLRYYERRARGGAGLLIVENSCVDYPLGSNGTTQLRIDHDRYIPRLYELCEAVHRQGASIAMQLNHAGASAMASRTGVQPVSASDVPTKDGGDTPRPLTEAELMEIVEKFGRAARRAQQAGFDAVEIHAGHSYLLSQFLSPTTNERRDEFGGSPENRARLAALVMQAVRRAVGPRYPILLRISADELVEGGNRLEDTLDLLCYFQAEADILDVSAGLNSSIQYQIDASRLPDGWRTGMARVVRERFAKPVITTGNIRGPRVAEDILERGDADLIGVGRGQVADPDWANKARAGRGPDIRRCISCNIGCAGHRIGLNRPIRCTMNPCVIDGEDDRRVTRPCNVAVIGGGTAGLEAACTAAERGCTVFLLEKKERLGGLTAQISQITDKRRLADFTHWLIRRAERLQNLYIFTGTAPDTATLRRLKPEIIVNATGSQPLLPPIPGLRENLATEGTRLYTILTMLEHIDDYPEELAGKRVVIIGGGAVGLDVAEFFALRGAMVRVVEMLPEIGSDLDPVTKSCMREFVKKYNLNLMPKTKLLEVKADCFVVQADDGWKELPFDYGFVCLGMQAFAPGLPELEEAFAESGVEILNIGDSLRARRIIDGVGEGHNILAILERKGLLARGAF